MDTTFYLHKFQKAADLLNKQLLTKKQVEVAVVMYKDAVVLKLYKKAWANNSQYPLTAESRIFFSVWVSDSLLKEQRIFYNIHALKLRKLSGYSIQSRKFAAVFRNFFKEVEPTWQNVSLKFGPLTLMEGWLQIDPENCDDQVLALAKNFLEIAHLVDDTLAQFK